MRPRPLLLSRLCWCAALLFVATILVSLPQPAPAQNPVAGPNSDPNYQALRNLALSGEAVSVQNLELKREAATFHLRSGTVCFGAPVNGKTTAAVFIGDGNLILEAPASEKAMLKLLTKEDEFSENFSQMTLRFTDGTYDEIKSAGKPGAAGCDPGPLKNSQHTTRHILKENIEARILADVLSPEPGGLFVAFIRGKRYNDEELFSIDPHESHGQVEFSTYDENKTGEWLSMRLREPKKGAAGVPIKIKHEQLDTSFEKSGNLTGKATTQFQAGLNGLRVVEFNLFHTLRVKSVTGEDGQPLSFIQEDKNEDAQFYVILPKVLASGDVYSVTTTYEGKEAVTNEGGGNYFPVARNNWYPSNPGSSFGEFADYDMTFRIPKGMQIAATGVRLSDNNDGGQNVSVWKSESPQTVAGFSFGKFKVEEAKLKKPEYAIESYANEESPNWVTELRNSAEGQRSSSLGMLGAGHEERPEVALGNLSTTGLNKKSLNEAELAVQLYTDFFGPSSFKHLQITQQTACNFGQSWPELVWIPLCYYFDTTVRHQLRMDWGDRGYWKVVTPHEVAHQWWGHTVGFSAARDQWMSEGFADMSASLYLSMIEKDPKKFIRFWDDERELLLERNAQGFRAIDVGPLTMGYRVSNSRAGFDVYRRLVYPKGAYVLHMIRMMMYDNRTGDQRFKETMQDFVKTYGGNAASTEDFKAMVEKHMTPEMDLDGNHKLDWFFNEYVYGTQLPAYKMDSSFDLGPDGDVVMSMKVAESNVDDNFKMLVPLYLQLADGKMFFLGRARMKGNNAIEQKVPLKGLKTKPQKAMLNYYDDVLASAN